MTAALENAQFGRNAPDGQDLQLPAGLRVELDGIDDLPPVVASQRSLVFVFTNLLENSCAAMDGTGTIRISGTASAHWVELEVSDDGPGIPPELHERIFEFGLADRNGNPGARLGFGLWWVRTLLVRMGGMVTVASDGEGGTSFRLKLPRAEVPGV